MPGEFVWVGYWIHSDAGWGKILEIHNAEREDVFVPRKETPRLVVAMWDGCIQIEIDISIGTDPHGRQESAYLCGCKQFIAPRSEECLDAWEQHKRVCGGTRDLFPSYFLIT